MIVRELTGGVYFGEPKQIIDLGNGQRRAIDTQVYDTYEIERIGRIAFELARKRAQQGDLVREAQCDEIGRALGRGDHRDLHKREYPDVELEHHARRRAAACSLCARPKQFDVVVTENLFGADSHLTKRPRLPVHWACCLRPRSATRGNRFGERLRALRAGARQRAGHRRQGDRQSDRDDRLLRHGACAIRSILASLPIASKKRFPMCLPRGCAPSISRASAKETLSTSQMGDAILARAAGGGPVRRPSHRGPSDARPGVETAAARHDANRRGRDEASKTGPMPDGSRRRGSGKIQKTSPTVLLALPRGGVPVAAEIAEVLDAPIDLVLVRKIGVPMATGAGHGRDRRWRVSRLSCATKTFIRHLRVDEREFQAVCDREFRRIERGRRLYLGNRESNLASGTRVAIVIDDGIATGATMKAALRATGSRRPFKLVLAVPVGPLGYNRGERGGGR